MNYRQPGSEIVKGEAALGGDLHLVLVLAAGRVSADTLDLSIYSINEPLTYFRRLWNYQSDSEHFSRPTRPSLAEVSPELALSSRSCTI